jgi:hypothetical protein
MFLLLVDREVFNNVGGGGKEEGGEGVHVSQRRNDFGKIG